MVWLYGSALAQRGATSTFVRRRLLRIYPVYWVVLAIVTPVYFLLPASGMGHERGAWAILTSIALIPTPEPPIVHVAWTLRHEVLFYLMFAVLLWHPKLGMAGFAIWATAIVGAFVAGLRVFPIDFFLSPFNLLFVYGMIAATIVRRGVPRPLLLAGVGTAAFLCVGWAEVYLDTPQVVTMHGFGLAAALAIMGFSAAERRGVLSVPRALSYLGDMSYSLYLIHFLTLSVTAKVIFAWGLGQAFPRWAMFMLILTITVAAGAIFYELIERPLIRWASGRSPSSDDWYKRLFAWLRGVQPRPHRPNPPEKPIH